MPKTRENTQCVVCGSSGSILKAWTLARKSAWLCYAHEYVCADHLQDPCNVCDVI